MAQDCPNHAVFVDVAAATNVASTGVVDDALCIFEDDRSTTAWRHLSTSVPTFSVGPSTRSCG